SRSRVLIPKSRKPRETNLDLRLISSAKLMSTVPMLCPYLFISKMHFR
ncbi:hypothetical protein TSMEX_011296, partial [Taenia solium]